MPDSSPPPPDVETEAPDTETTARLIAIFLGGLFALAVLATCYAAAEIILPVVLAFVLSAVLRPVMRLLARLHIPHFLAALLIVLALVGAFVMVGLMLSGPIADRVAQLPDMLPRLQSRLHFLSALVNSLQNGLNRIASLAPDSHPLTVAVQSAPLAQRILENVRFIGGGAFTTLVLLFFVLVAGEQFLRRLVEILPGFKRKRQVVVIASDIESDISVYLATITMMNTAVGIATGIMAWLCGLGSPLLWGTIAFLLNYVPILGPTAGVLLFLTAGLVTIDPLWTAFLPASLYLLIHVAEGETVTPMLIARRFTVNPVLIMLGVIFWYWMWGVVGAILATPMLAIAKIICDRIDSLKPFGHFIGGEPITLVPQTEK